MIGLPTNPGVVVLGCLLRDPDEGPWGGGAPHGPSLPPRPPCLNCDGTGWTNDPYYGGVVGVPCPACRGGG
jgi:hypothetical protein